MSADKENKDMEYLRKRLEVLEEPELPASLSPAVHRGGGGGISARTRADPGHWPPDPWGARTGCAPSLFIFNPGAMCYTDGEKDVRKHGPL